MIKLVAFDWKGTLLSDTLIVWRADNMALKKIKQKPISLIHFKKSFDMPVIKYWQNVGFSENFLKKNLDKLENEFIKEYRATENKAKLRANARACLDWLKTQKVSTVLFSNAPNDHIHKHLRKLKVDHTFKDVLGRDPNDTSYKHMRGKQERLRAFVKKYKFKPHEIISVGDTVEELEIGKHLGYHTVAITGGYNTTARLNKHHPDFLIDNMKELIGIIKTLNK